MFRKALAKSDVVFTHRSDFLPLVDSHKEAFDTKTRQVKVLLLDELPAAEIDILADSLQSYQLEELKLVNCDTNIKGFFLRLSWVQSLRKVAFQRCNIRDEEMKELVQALTSRCRWTCLDLRSNLIGDAGAAILADAFSNKPGLEEVILRDNLIEDAGTKRLLEAWRRMLGEEDDRSLQAKRPLLHLDLRENHISQAGVAMTFALKLEKIVSMLPQNGINTAVPIPFQFAIESSPRPANHVPLVGLMLRKLRAFGAPMLQTVLRVVKRRTV